MGSEIEMVAAFLFGASWSIGDHVRFADCPPDVRALWIGRAQAVLETAGVLPISLEANERVAVAARVVALERVVAAANRLMDDDTMCWHQDLADALAALDELEGRA